MRWGIATCCYDHVKPWYCRSLVETLYDLGEPDGFQGPEYILVDHLYMPNAREQAALAAKQINLQGVLWIDADMEWTAYDVLRMLHLVRYHPKAVIAFPYPARKLNMWIGQPKVDALPNKHGLVKAYAIGFGFTWTPIACFERKEPWFNVQFVKGEGFIGEDIWFTRHLPRVFNVLLAHDCSVGHSYEPGTRLSIEEDVQLQSL